MNEILKTKCGDIRGTSCQWEGVTAFKGIRYANAERWSYPQLVESWEGVYDASSYGNCSWQPRAFYDEEKNLGKVFYYNEFRKGETYTYSDDCLFLNIWKPESADKTSKLPVIFYIHGGGYTGGCGHEKHFDGPVWPTKGCIAVTINYRLGPMGFMCLPELKEEAGHTGNYGLFDQIAALKWVKANIEDFGGNPDNITIMGQSAGAMSVQQLVLSPLTEGLFHKAVMNSGGGVSKLMNSKATSEERYAFWESVKKKAGCTTLEELRNIDAEKLFEAWTKVKKEIKGAGMIASPCIDGYLMTESNLDAAKAGKQKNIPYLMGSTSEDIVPLVIHGMAKDWCKIQSEQNKQNSYCWFFDRRLPGDDKGAWHSSELWYFFGTLKNCWRPFTEKDVQLSDEMSTALCNFAKNGNPNGSDLPEWKSVTSNHQPIMMWGEKQTHLGKPSNFKLLKTMLTNKAVGE